MSVSVELLTRDMEKAEVINNIFALVYTGNCSFYTSQVTKSQGRDWRNEVPLVVGEDQV